MQAVNRIGRWFWRLGAALLATLLLPQASLACLAHYVSPDELVADSPLIVIARVEKVEKTQPKLPPPGILILGAATRLDPDKPGPAIAQVRILRVLKGRYAAPTVAVGSGPVGSCAPYAVHYGFTVGEERIFLLPEMPGKTEVVLRYGGSVLPVSHTEMIEQRIARAREYRAAYLARIERELPKAYAAAAALDGQLRSESAQWPELTRISAKDAPDWFTYEEGPEFKAAKAKLLSDLAKVEVEAIRTALAINWFSEDVQPWSKRALWQKTLADFAPARRQEIATAERACIRRELTYAGVASHDIDSYLAATADSDLDERLSFPPEGPNAYRKHIPNNLTSDFILRFHGYYRGAMFRDYGMDFNALAALDPVRVKTMVAALYRSDDARLRIVARRVIERVPGTTFVDLVLDDMEDNFCAWSGLVSKDEKETERRLTAMLDLAVQHLSAWGRESLWRDLRRGECFHEVCVNRAIGEVERIERQSHLAENVRQAMTDENRKLLVALRVYLAAAMAHREAKPIENHTADEYRAWFKAHER